MTASPVTVQDPNTPANQLAVNGLGQVGIANFPPTQSIIGNVMVTNFPANQVVSGTIAVTNFPTSTAVASLPGGTTSIPFYDVIQDPTTPANKLKVNSDGSINVTGSITATNPSVGTDGSAIPTSSTLIGASDGANLQQLLVESSSNRNLRVGLYSGANEVTVTGSNALKVDNSAVTQPVSGTFWQATQPVSVASLPLPSGVSTSAKQPALGTAGTASSDVITVQGITSMTALKVDGSGVTQPVSGTVTANAGTNLNTSALALDTSVNGVLVSQGSTTSGQKGPLMQGAVTTTAPSYTTAQSSPLSLDTSGLLRASLKDTPSNTNNLNVNLAASVATVTVSASNLQTNLNQIGGSAIVTGGASGLMAVGGPVASGAANADNPVKAGGVFKTPQPTVTNGQVVDAQMTARGAQIVATGVDAFATNASQAGTWTVMPGNTANTTAWLVQGVTGTTGGSTPYHLISVSGTNSTNVKGSAGQLYGLSISNSNAAARFFKLYDKATAPTVGTDTPKRTVQVPANGTVVTAFPVGLNFANGIGFGLTTGIADADTGSVGTDISVDLDYK